MDNHTRKLLGLTDKSLHFEEEWLFEKEYKGVQAQFIRGKLDDSPSHCEHCESVRIIRNVSYTTRTQMLKFKEKLTLLDRNFYNFRARIYLQQGLIFKN